MPPLPLSPFRPPGPAVVPYKAKGVFTPCPTPLPSSCAFLGQADVPSLLSLIACCPYGVAWAVLGSPTTPLPSLDMVHPLQGRHNPFAARLMGLLSSFVALAVALAGSPELVVVIEQTKGHLQKIIL